MSPPRKRQSSAGFTLVEVMIAATVLMIGVSGTIVTNVASWNLTRTSEETQLVTVAATDVLERLKLLAPEEIAASYPVSTPLPVQETGLTDLVVVATYPNYAVGDGVITIQLNATWTTFDGNTRTLQFTSAV